MQPEVAEGLHEAARRERVFRPPEEEAHPKVGSVAVAAPPPSPDEPPVEPMASHVHLLEC